MTTASSPREPEADRFGAIPATATIVRVMDAEIAKRAQEVDKLVRKLDPAVRAEAFSLFRDYILEGDGASPPDQSPGTTSPVKTRASGSAKSFFQKHESDKPAENVMALAAYLYGEYGTAPFAFTEIRDIGNEIGATIPDRVDMTLVQLKRDGKVLFKRAGVGKFRPTVQGEAALKKAYDVKKGTKQRPPEAAK
jgi:hypothetical protein